MTNNREKAADVIDRLRAEGKGSYLTALELSKEGLLQPDLPEPTTATIDPEWEQKYLEEYEWVPDAEWHPTNAFFINVKDGNVNAGFWETQENWEGMNPADLKAIGLALLAAADHAQK